LQLSIEDEMKGEEDKKRKEKVI